MKPLSSAARNVRASATMAVDTKAKQLKAEGKDVISFGAGEPDFDTPYSVKQAGIRAIEENKTRYTPAAGMIPLRRAIAERIKLDSGIDYDYTQIVVTAGAKHSVYLALAVLLDPGDEVIVPVPYWVSYGEMVPLFHAVPVYVTGGEEQGFKITTAQLEAAITPKTKAIILNNPSNPSGMLYTRPELQAIAEVCAKHDLYIIADEVYDKLVFDGLEFVSVAALGENIAERSIVINGVSKAYRMTGWRIGWSASNPEIAGAMAAYVGHSTGSPSTISQWAALEALSGPQDEVERQRLAFQQRRDYIYKRMNEIEGVSCIKPQGAFYAMMNINGLIGRTLGGRVIHNADDFAGAFLETKLVAVVPCTASGMPDFIRWTYAASMEDIRKGMDRLEEFINNR